MTEKLLTGTLSLNTNKQNRIFRPSYIIFYEDKNIHHTMLWERGGSVVECRTPEREVRGSKPTATVLCPWARHITPQKYWLIAQEAMAPSRHDWKIIDWDVKPQHKQTLCCVSTRFIRWSISISVPLLLHTDGGISLIPLYRKLNLLGFE